MAIDIETGPFITMGNASYPTNANGTPVNNIEEIDIEAGPNIEYQASSLVDPRFFVQKDYAAGRPGSILAQLNSPYILSCDQVPAASAATPVNIAAAQTATSGTPFTLAAASAGISTGVPFYPFKSSVLTIANIALDFGFMGAAASAGVDTLSINGTVTATASSLLAASNFYPGQYLIMPNAGASATTNFICYVVSVVGTTITLSAAPGQTTSTAMVGSANIPQVNWPGNPAATGARPYLAGGAGAFMNPKECICRGVGVNAAAGATGTTVLISGWDIHGQPQTESITISAGATVYGNKTWKYIQSATPQFTDAGHNYSVGTSDLFGFVVRTDRWEYTNIFYNGTFATSSSGWTGGDLTTPATTTTKDVRGTVQTSARGPGSTPSAPLNTPTTGAIRLALFTSLPLYNVIAATPATPQPMYGVFPV
jgi:hypothetical protein